MCDLIETDFYPRFLCQCDPTVDTEGVIHTNDIDRGIKQKNF